MERVKLDEKNAAALSDEESPLAAQRVETQIDPKMIMQLGSPTTPLEMNSLKTKKRRPVRRWSILEETTLRIGVQECGPGNWKAILDIYRSVFKKGRTCVDLKDKWRNMMLKPKRKRMSY